MVDAWHCRVWRWVFDPKADDDWRFDALTRSATWMSEAEWNEDILGHLADGFLVVSADEVQTTLRKDEGQFRFFASHHRDGVQRVTLK